MDYICTWICTDAVGEESSYPQKGGKYLRQKNKNLCWQCIMLFFATSKRFNKTQKHVLFSNTKSLPVVDGRKVDDVLAELEVDVIFTEFNYRPPKGYFKHFQNQFYEFSIMEYIINNNINLLDNYLILDSDCIFTQPVAPIFQAAAPKGFMSFEDNRSTDLVVHGMSRKDMKRLYEELLGRNLDEIPTYHLGEFFLANVKNIRLILDEFKVLWPKLLYRFEIKLSKFNEEAQTLSFIYYKNNFKASDSRIFLKRIWTNPVFYRNVKNTDLNVAIWHLPAETTYGLIDLYRELVLNQENFGLNLPNDEYLNKVKTLLGIPLLSFYGYWKYYFLSYYRAISRRIKTIFGR